MGQRNTDDAAKEDRHPFIWDQPLPTSPTVDLECRIKDVSSRSMKALTALEESPL